MANTSHRGGDDFAYSTTHIFNLDDTIGSLIFPPSAQAEGWYYFGILGVLLILSYLTSRSFFSYNRTNLNNIYQNVNIKIFFIGWIALISYISYGKDSYLFIFLWNNMPFFSNLRVWGRINIILIPIISWLLAVAYIDFENFISKNININCLIEKILTLSFFYFFILYIQIILFNNKIYDSYWVQYFHIAPKENTFIIFGKISFIVLCILLIFSYMLRNFLNWLLRRYLVVVTLIILTFLSILEIRSGNINIWIWTVQNKPIPLKKELEISLSNHNSFKTPRNYRVGISHNANFSVGIIPTWYFSQYVQFF
ncbi:MAG: hypothetical protein HC877_17080 [Thioploca sp.]|nr:hypothetical protein [Thioploca sp.]